MQKQYSDEEIRAYKDKKATVVQTRMADWLIEKLDLEFQTAKAEAAFRKAVQLTVALRMIFQASPENQAARAAGADAEPEVEEEKPAKPAKKAKAAVAAVAAPAKAKPKAKAKAAPPPSEDEDEETVAPAPKKRAPKKAVARAGAAAPF